MCGWCGSPPAGPGAPFCSIDCNKAKDRSRSRARDRAQGRSRTAFPLYVRKHVHARDEWTCHVCGGETSQRYVHGDPLSPTVDHLLPVSWTGGPVDALWNLATAHERCNRQRGAGFGAGALARITATRLGA